MSHLPTHPSTFCFMVLRLWLCKSLILPGSQLAFYYDLSIADVRGRLEGRRKVEESVHSFVFTFWFALLFVTVALAMYLFHPNRGCLFQQRLSQHPQKQPHLIPPSKPGAFSWACFQRSGPWLCRAISPCF